MKDLSIDPSQEVIKITRFLQNAISRTPYNKLIIGLSGGIDSSVCAALTVHALGKDNIYVVTLPYSNLSLDALPRVKQLTARLSLPPTNIIDLDITRTVDSLVGNNTIDPVRKGNIIARTRMTVLFDLSKKYQALVCGTENKTEYLLGYFTRFGDEASDIEPIRHLYKTQIKQLSHHLKIPPEIINTLPTAGLWEGQTDEKELGFSYAEADQILHLWYDKKMKKEEIIKSGFDLPVVEKVIKRVEENEFKHKLPYILK